VFHFPEGLFFWGAYLWVFAPEVGLVRNMAPAEQDAGTAQIIVVGNASALVLGFIFSFVPLLLIPEPQLAFGVGIAMMVAGGFLRRLCFRTLGQYFTGMVTVSEGQPVIDVGPYRWVRHPSYTAGFLLFGGIGLALGSWLSVAALFLIPCYTYYWRVTAEETALLTTLGEPYRAYMSRTKRFIPFIF